MKVRLQLGPEEFEVELERTPKGVRASCEGAVADYVALEGADGIRLESAGRPGRRVELVDDGAARVDGHAVRYHVAAYEPGAPALVGGAAGPVPVRAVMQGRLVRVLVEAGQRVERGQGLFVIEAMKMQNRMESPVAGGVVSVGAREGDVVEPGRVLAQIEPG